MNSGESKQMITCPKCGTKFALGDAILKPLRLELQENLRKEYDERLDSAKKRLEQETREQAEQRTAMQVKELSREVEKLNKELEKAQEHELKVREERRELEQQQKKLKLEIARKVDEEIVNMKKQLAEEYGMKEQENLAKIAGMKTQIDELKRKAEVGSQQVKGEIGERKLEDILSDSFPNDSIERVPKGVKGADVLQKVNGKSGECCGTIIWESKNTQNWGNSWIGKLKENKADQKAEIAVLVSAVIPEDIDNFGLINDVWVTRRSFVTQLASALRFNLIELHNSRITMEGKGQKVEMLYDYVTKPQFKQRVETIVGAFMTMSNELIQERQAMERIWNKREKQIELIMKGTSGMIGDLEGIVGASLPQIHMLAMPHQLESGASEDV